MRACEVEGKKTAQKRRKCVILQRLLSHVRLRRRSRLVWRPRRLGRCDKRGARPLPTTDSHRAHMFLKFIYAMSDILSIFAFFFALRLATLAISIRNEKRLLRQGAVQYGRRNSALLTLAHVAYYGLALYEAYARGVCFDGVSAWGVGVMAFAYAMLFYVVYKIRDVWTVKLYIAPNHRIERSFLFRTVRHPNYYLNIIPELIGLALLCHAWGTLAAGLPLYLCILAVRIRREEQVMKHLWASEAA